MIKVPSDRRMDGTSPVRALEMISLLENLETVLEQLGDHKYASLQIDLNMGLREYVEGIRKDLPTEIVDPEEDAGTPHITVFYGLEAEDLQPLRQGLKDVGPVTFTLLDRIDYFRHPTHQVGIFPIESSDLHKLHARIRLITKKVPPTYKTYHPHCTLAYLKANTIIPTTLRLQKYSDTVETVSFHLHNGDPVDIKLHTR
jgi:2'-5' RNA ligase